MRYINTLCEGETIRNIYLCKGKRSAETRNGKPYDNLILQDKTGTLDGKVWDPNSGGIADYDEMDFIEVYGEIISYNNALQMNIKQIRKAYEDEYNAADYMPTTQKNPEGMSEKLTIVGIIVCRKGGKFFHFPNIVAHCCRIKQIPVEDRICACHVLAEFHNT